MNGAAPGRCSQLSTTSSSCLTARKRSTASAGRLACEQNDRERAHDRRGNVLRALDSCERHEACAVGEVGLDGARGLEREPRLADAARPGEGQQAHRP